MSTLSAPFLHRRIKPEVLSSTVNLLKLPLRTIKSTQEEGIRMERRDRKQLKRRII
jgi:hypothetical protein